MALFLPHLRPPFLVLSGVGLTFSFSEKGSGLQFFVYHCKNKKNKNKNRPSKFIKCRDSDSVTAHMDPLIWLIERKAYLPLLSHLLLPPVVSLPPLLSLSPTYSPASPTLPSLPPLLSSQPSQGV